MLGQNPKYEILMECGCPNPVIHYSSDFESNICQNCGVILGEERQEKDYVPLRVHTHLSFLRAISKSEDLIAKCKEFGITALAKTEFNNLCGVPTFVKQCNEAGIKPIIGTDFTITVASQDHQIVIIALNKTGYRELIKLNSILRSRKELKLIEVDIPTSQDLIALIDVHRSKHHIESLLWLLQRMTTYLEVNQDNDQDFQLAESFAYKYDIEVVATPNTLYTGVDDKKFYTIATKIGNHVAATGDFFFRSIEEMYMKYKDSWLHRTVEIANKVEDYGIINKEPIVPTFKDKDGEWSTSEVHAKLEIGCWTSLQARGLASNQVYVERLLYELSLIKSKKFSSYFLIINEVIEYMKQTNKLKPYGRGSSVGSLVCFLLDITSMDPIKWDVPFERFITQNRIDLPDIDTDITQVGRADVLRHIADVHGHDRVAQIATYQTMALKASIDNVGRALQVPHSYNRELRKLIPDEVESIDEIPPGIKKTMFSAHPEWVNCAIALTGCAKNLGYHAAGIVISNEALINTAPLMPEDDGLSGIQYDMHDCEVLGLLKLDMLGLKTLDIIQDTIIRIKEKRSIDVDIYNLPEDKATYDTISGGNYVSIFQLDSTGYRRLCRQLKPESFHHIMALNALYRPGPLESGVTGQYVNRRHGKEEAISWHPWLDKALSSTYQTVLFQEQAMAMSRIIAGFTETEADEFRKGIGKKNEVSVAKSLTKFKEGALKREGLVPPKSWSGTIEEWVDDLIKKLSGYARYIWCSGHACLAGDTLISTCNQGLVPIRDIRVNDIIWSRGLDGFIFKNRVVKTHNNGVRDTVCIRTISGKYITCTADHKFLLENGKYKQASKLKYADRLVTFTEIDIVKDIKDDNSIQVYDLSMEQDPNYIANGFVVHNCGYGAVTYTTAYLEANYPLEYYTALLDHTSNPDKLSTLIRSIIARGVVVVPPHINESVVGYTSNNGNVYMGLAAIKSLGKSAADIIENRQKFGKFNSFVEFCQRMPSINKTVKVNLIKAGAFNWDKMIHDRNKLDNVDTIQKLAKKKTKTYDGSTISPYQIVMECYLSDNDFTEVEKQQHEREVLNSFITGHPAAVYHRIINHLDFGGAAKVVLPSTIENKDCNLGDIVLVVGMIDAINKKTTKAGRPYLQIFLTDSYSQLMIHVWDPMCETLEKVLVANQLAMFEGVIQPDRLMSDKYSLKVHGGIMLHHGVPIQGVHYPSGDNPEPLLQHIGGVAHNTIQLNNKTYTSIRGLITVKPHIIEEAINKFGSDVGFLLSMGNKA